MPSLRSLGQAVSASSLFVTFATASSCYYPDGSTSSSDVPCGNGTSSNATACCPSNSYCMDNGLCFTGGIVSRASCTDQTWGSDACPGYCKTVTPNAEIQLSPCTSNNGTNTFACGLNSTTCDTVAQTFPVMGGQSFNFRPSQVQSGNESTSSTHTNITNTVTVTAAPANATAGMYTSGSMAGLGIGLTLPLLAALGFIYILLKRERDRTPKLMYPLPDDCKDDAFSFRPTPPGTAGGLTSGPGPAYAASVRTLPVSRDESDAQSLRTLASARITQPPAHMMSFMERYQAIKDNMRMQEHRVELDSNEVQPHERHELSDHPPMPSGYPPLPSRSMKSMKSSKSVRSTRSNNSVRSTMSSTTFQSAKSAKTEKTVKSNFSRP